MINLVEDLVGEEITNEQLKKLLSYKLVMLREQSGQTVEATAASLDMDLSEYYRLLRGSNLPHLRTLLRISQKYNVTLDWWFDGLNTVSPQVARNVERLRRKSLEEQLLSFLRALDTKLQEAVLDLARSLARKTKKNRFR
ncbi:MAG: helix-turn-helix domain-containing protein [Candidatus Margulisbacteria bacterium]|jgi:transcriptional regulator with XRE-family HTH domain|nr:helix-turn-helix domain-containing protein [Candidatus Margulisiibacteriota bacterium]